MSATTAVMIQIILAGGLAGGVLLALVAYAFGIGRAVLTVAAIVFGTIAAAAILAVFWPGITAIAYNTFFRKPPVVGRHRIHSVELADVAL